MKRQIRVSAYNDYVAVDLVNDKDEIISTPFYLTHKGMQKVLYKDDGVARITNVFLLSDGHTIKLSCRDSEGFDFHMPIDELLDESIVTKFLSHNNLNQ